MAIKSTESAFHYVLLVAVAGLVANFVAFETGLGVARERVVGILTAKNA